MGSLILKLSNAVEIKPAFGKPCNNCGYCCLTEVCPIGQDLTGTAIGPCSLLIERDNKHYCQLIENGLDKSLIGAGEGCCAETQQEAITRLMSK